MFLFHFLLDLLLLRTLGQFPVSYPDGCNVPAVVNIMEHEVPGAGLILGQRVPHV